MINYHNHSVVLSLNYLFLLLLHGGHRQDPYSIGMMFSLLLFRLSTMNGEKYTIRLTGLSLV